MISVILPIGSGEARPAVKACLDHLAHQNYSHFEVIIATFPSQQKRLRRLFHRYPFIRIVTGLWSKTAARNAAAKLAKGNYLLNLDVDMHCSPGLLKELAQKSTAGSIATVIPEQGSNNTNFWGRCRNLEKQINQGNPILETALFLEKNLFFRLGGFDELADPLDDWQLHLALQKARIKTSRAIHFCTVHQAPTLRSTFSKLFYRGQAYPYLYQKYRPQRYLNLRRKTAFYLKRWRLLIASPLYAVGLFILKMTDLTAFTIGRRFPNQPYQLNRTARFYLCKRLKTNFTRYKHYCEIESANRLLENPPLSILEVGCGTGRLTVELTKRGYSVLPTDPSPVMLKYFPRRRNLPRPLLADGRRLPFPARRFPTVIALRVLWHLPSPVNRLVLKEISRVAASTVIADIANKRRLFGFLFSDPRTYPAGLSEFLRVCRKNQLEADTVIPLDVTLPIWLNLFPRRLAERLFPLLYRLDLKLGQFLPPGRYLIKLRRSTVSA